MAKLKMKHRLLLNGAPHDVWLSRRGKDYFLLSECGERLIDPVPEAIVVADGDDIYIHHDGRAYTVRFQDPRDRFAEDTVGKGGHVTRAPMPGSVIDVFVEVGRTVGAGEPLLVIESMKLQTTIKASHDGIVRDVHYHIGQTFDRDAVLVTLSDTES
jgi:3-methylcrotonyl-CoA carboxylase alpha subunit